MTKVVNLRTVRKRAARDKAAQTAKENRSLHGVSKAERNAASVTRERGRKKLDQHKIVRGDR